MVESMSCTSFFDNFSIFSFIISVCFGLLQMVVDGLAARSDEECFKIFQFSVSVVKAVNALQPLFSFIGKAFRARCPLQLSRNGASIVPRRSTVASTIGGAAGDSSVQLLAGAEAA